jgi:hypothetical protein
MDSAIGHLGSGLFDGFERLHRMSIDLKKIEVNDGDSKP